MSENPNIEKTYSEAILIEIRRIADRDEVSMFEACTLYADEIDLDVEELVERLDSGAIALLRQSAIDDNRVRQCVGVRADALEFE